MPVQIKGKLKGLAHVQPAHVAHTPATKLKIAQAVSVRRASAQPPTLNKAPWEEEDEQET